MSAGGGEVDQDQERFLGTEKHTIQFFTPKHTDSHFVDTRLKIYTLALPVVSVTNIRCVCHQRISRHCACKGSFLEPPKFA